MKKFTHFLALTLVALWFVAPTVSAQDCDFTPNLFPGQSADRTDPDEVVYATVHVGEFGQCENLHRGNTINPFNSDNTSAVVTYSERGYNPAIFFVGVGEATVTYTENVQRPACSTNHTVHYTVEKGTPDIYFAGLDGSPITEYEVRSGGASAGGTGEGAVTGGAGGTGVDGGTGEDGGGSSTPWTPTLVLKYKVLAGSTMVTTNLPNTAVITFNSTNPSIATVSRSGITLQGGLGEVTLTATWGGDDNWKAATATLHLTVKKQVTISFEESIITNKHIGDEMDAPTPIMSQAGLPIHWTHTKPAVATVDETTGHVTVLCNGTDTISAVFDGNDQYYPAKGSYILQVSPKDADLSFDIDTAFVEIGVPWTPPTVNNPHNLDLNNCKWGVSEWNDPVASIDEATGAITIKGPGTTIVSCEYQDFGCVEYGYGAAYYVLRVSSTCLRVLGELVTSANKNDVLGDGGSVTFEETATYRTLTLHSANIDGAGAEAFIVDSISPIMSATVPIRVAIDGNSFISNVQKGIVSVGGAILMWGNNKKDTLDINATGTAMEAPLIKIHDSYIFANGANYGLYCPNELGISAGGYVFARGTGESGVGIYLHPSYGHFVKGQGGIGGIEVLTKGVYYNEDKGAPHGFLWADPYNKEPVNFVEIGKVPLPVKEDEVTDITFDGEGENPDENLDVVFSSSEDDTFNEAEGQIEINTTTDDETLENTLTAHVTCSADWLKKLPGVLVFDVPAGEGQFQIQCEVAAGFHAEAYIEGVGQAVITSPKAGWIQVSYNVVAQTHVILYLQADGEQSAAPARVAKAKKDAEPGLAIKSIKITPKDAPTGVEENFESSNPQIFKSIKEAQLLILRDGKTYTVTGQQVQ